jgi:4-alpha-glucanotransferase
VEISDFDVDGQDEVLVETALHNAYFKPDKGAAMFEYDFKPVAKNILDTLSRREEGYHHKLRIAKLANGSDASDQGSTASIHDLILTKEPGLEKYLNYDWYEHKSLIDHFFDQSATPELFIQVKYNELGDFVNQPYQLITNKKTKEKVILTFSRNGHIRNNGQIHPVSIKKTVSIHINSTDIDIDYELTNNGEGNIAVDFGVEFNFGLQAGHADDRYYYDRQGKLENYFLDSLGEIHDQDFLGLRDEYMKIDITLHSNKKATIWRMPVETVSLSEAGFERVYQSSLVLFKWHINLSKSWKVSFSHKTKVWEK